MEIRGGAAVKTDVMGVQFDNVTMQQALEQAQELLERPGADYCVTPNAEIVYEAMQDASFAQLLNDAALVLPDGAGVVKAARILGEPLQEKVAGVDFATALLKQLAQQGKRLYLLGGKPGIAEKAAERMQEANPKLQICGCADGYFRPEEETAVVARINAAQADVLFVCLGAPKQERFMQTHQAQLNVSFMAGLGGSLDAFAGTVRRAPNWMIRMQLEWFYRLCKEPKRLGRMMRLPKFLLAVYHCRLSGGRHG